MTASNRSASASRLPLWGALCFFASGAAGLLYEIVWSKQLAYLLGSSLHAVATVVAAFLCGLAIGARVLGVPLARRGQGGRIYALLEIGVGVLGLAMLPILRGIEPLVGEMYRSMGGESLPFAFARFGLLFALLIPPAALMGATLPVLVAHFERDWVGAAMARLYALNTLGAVAGSAAGGFLLLPGIGLAATSYVAAGLNVLVGGVAWLASRNSIQAPAPVANAPVSEFTGALTGGARTTFAVLFACSGFAALALQIAWVRLFSLVIGSSVYSFSAVLGVYLFGLALGSALVAGFLRRGVSLASFGLLQLALAVSTSLGTHAFSRLPDAMYELGLRSGADWRAVFVGEIGMIATLLLVPCALLGAAFPMAMRLLQQRDGGHAAGFAYAVNTAGTILGSLAAGFLLVPRWGVQGTHLAATLLCAALGLAALTMSLARRESRPMQAVVGLGLLVASIAFIAVAPPWDPSLMSAGAFRPSQADNLTRYAQAMSNSTGSTVYRATRTEKLLYYREGENGSVLVGTDPEGKERWLRVGGKIDASTQDMETQVLLGLIPAILADSGARSLVIGLGSGYTAAAVLAGGAGSTEVVELEQGVVEASRFFHPPGQSPLDDPRTTLVVGDARTHLAHSAGRYGLIVSEPSNPWIAGVNNLFTVDFYRRVRNRLEPDGVFCQWMQLYELTPETFRSMIASYLEVFPQGEVFTVWRAVDMLLVASPHGRSLALDRLSSPSAQRMLSAARIASPQELAAYYTGPLASLVPIARGATLNRDDRPVVEYRAPRDLIAVGRSSASGHPDVVRFVPFAERMPESPMFAAWTPEDWYGRRARFHIAAGDTIHANAALRGAGNAGFTALRTELRGQVLLGQHRQIAQSEFENVKQLLALGRKDDARLALERIVVLDPTFAQAWLVLSDRRRLAGDLPGASLALQIPDLAEDGSVRSEAAIMHALVAVSQKRFDHAIERIREAERLQPNNAKAYLLEARIHVTVGDAAAARSALQRGLLALPAHAELSSALQAMGG